VHHEFLTALLNGIAEGRGPLAQGAARAAEQLGPAAKQIYENQYAAYGYMSHHVRNIAAALHWATDTRDPFNSCHDYLNFGTDAGFAARLSQNGAEVRMTGSAFTCLLFLNQFPICQRDAPQT
jgi:hypothetical protein